MVFYKKTTTSGDIEALPGSTDAELHEVATQEKKGGFFSHLSPGKTLHIPLPALTTDEQKVHDSLKRIQWLMDESVKAPWNKEKNLGIDPIIGLIPVAGDVVSAMVSLGFVCRAAPVLSRYTVTRMLTNVMLDAFIGLIPFFGDVCDFGFKANTRNMAIFEDHMKTGITARGDTDRAWVITAAVCFVGVCMVGSAITVAAFVFLVLYLTGRL